MRREDLERLSGDQLDHARKDMAIQNLLDSFRSRVMTVTFDQMRDETEAILGGQARYSKNHGGVVYAHEESR